MESPLQDQAARSGLSGDAEPEADLATQYARASKPPKISLGIVLGGLVGLASGSGNGWFIGLGQALGPRDASPPMLVAASVAAACVAVCLLAAPPLFWLYRVQKRFGLARMPAGNWLGRYLRGAAVLTVWLLLWAEAVLAIYHFSWPWPALVGLWAVLAWRLSRLPFRRSGALPLASLPEFAALSDRLRTRAVALGVPRVTVEVLRVSDRTRAANALALAHGSRPRILLTDTLLELLTAAEAESVFIHEIGHLRGRDVLRSWGYRAGAVAGAFALAPVLGAAPPPAGALLSYAVGFCLVWVPLTWAFNALRRRQELAADRFAYQALGDTEVLGAALRKLHRAGLVEAAPGGFHRVGATHPPLERRLAEGQRWRLHQVAAGASTG